MKNKAACQYLKQVKRELLCDRKRYRALLDRVKAMVEKFLEERPDAEYADLTAAFGSPQSFAENMLEGVSPAEIDRAQRRKQQLRRLTAALIVLALITLSVFWYCKYKQSKSIDDYAIIVTYPPGELTEEELSQFLKDAQNSARAEKGE